MTRRYAVIGDPVSHSLSPLLHSGWIKDHNLDATYEALLLRSEDPSAAIRNLVGFTGVNVTVPHKEAAGEAADRSGARVANVLRWESDGSISAFNTDGEGFLDSLDEDVAQWRTSVKAVLIIGAGGAAREIGRALGQSGEDYQGRLSSVERVVFVNRTFSRAISAAEGSRAGEAGKWSDLEAHFAGADLIVNATTLGMNGVESQVWPLDVCGPNTIVADIVYRPLETELLRLARDRGLTAVDGLGMLVHQGARAFELWFGIKPDVAKARERLLAALA